MVRMVSSDDNGESCDPIPQDAVEWFVRSNSGYPQDLALLSRWNRWCGHPQNRMEYAKVLQMCRDVRNLMGDRRSD
jgi:hypothetical protein